MLGLAADAAFLPSLGAVIAIVLQGALLVGCAACLLSVLLRRVEAPLLVKVWACSRLFVNGMRRET